ncbi:PBP1A family penicillin-binding protein [Paenibacillus ginsengarvi]|uniref:PBP1A family penicillin-binding protein n=2 Tax=Paenibacillus ginsengarvi TaxID=400777 RepID=A0A3B0C1X7_9BACL|nr:PBP1A family penicillin-binding protein [Paenibacillus ginsengarvi]
MKQQRPIPKVRNPASTATKKTSRRKPWLRAAGVVLIAAVAAALLAFAALALWVRSLDIGKLANPLLGPTQLMDRNGNVVSELSSSKIVPVPLERIPLQMRQAVVVVEDRRFYDHSGVDTIGILRALYRNVTDGGVSQGGSTITQQLAKNVFLSNEQTLSRKLNEAAYAFKIEQTYDKNRILETYLNQIYFGEGQWGIQQAAKTYFGKDVEQLTLAESAMLAALPKAPSHYSPFKNKEKALERRNLVLELMLGEQYISDTDYKAAIAEPLPAAGYDAGGLRGQYGYYLDQVIEEAIETYGLTERQLLAGGLRIYTELDSDVQNAMETTYRNDALFPRSEADQLMQSGAVILDPYTGGVRGIVGGRGEHVYRGFNHATQLKRQPGSSFKPLVVYAPAIEMGYGPASRLYDGPLDINGYKPADWDKRTRGEVTLREAVIRSWNIPAVWLLHEIGLQTGKSFASKLGIPFAKGDDNLAVALGGLQDGVSPLQMAQAYGMFPNLGVMMPAHTIVKLTTASGSVLAEAQPVPIQAMSAAGAYTVTGLLQDVVREGTGSNAAMNRPVAGKTGTTQLPETAEFAGVEGSKDAWFVGYTPELVGAVWIGYDHTDRNHTLSTSGGYTPALVFKEMMGLALKDVAAGSFKQLPPADNRNSGGWGASPGSKENGNKQQPPGKAKKADEKKTDKGKPKDDKKGHGKKDRDEEDD